MKEEVKWKRQREEIIGEIKEIDRQKIEKNITLRTACLLLIISFYTIGHLSDLSESTTGIVGGVTLHYDLLSCAKHKMNRRYTLTTQCM